MSEQNVRKKVVGSFFWRFAERTGAQGVSLIVSIILARLLLPSDYGITGLISVFLAVAGSIVASGFGSALIQKKNADSADYSSVFYFNIVMSLVMYAVLFAAAPFIAKFYHEPELKAILRVLSITLIFGGVNGVQYAYVSKTMQFKIFFFSTIIGTVISAFVGIFLAYHGAGVWALVAQSLTNQICDTVILWGTVKWRPTLEFSLSRMRGLFSFGWKMFASGLLDTLYNNIYSLIIGRVYSSEQLGYYNRGNSVPAMVINNINNSIQSVIYPALAGFQDDRERVKAMVRRSIIVSTFIIMPLMAGLAAVARPLVTIVLTEKWLPCVPILQLSCFTYALWPVHTANLQAISALGRSDIFLKLEIIKKVMGIGLLFITVPHGVIAMLSGSCVAAVISSFLNAYPNKKLLNYSYFEQIKDIMPATLLACVMALLVWCISLFHLNIYLTLALQIVFGATFYIGLSYLFKFESFFYVIDVIKDFIRRK